VRLFLCLLLALAPGCVTLGRTKTGTMPPADAIEGLRKGEPLGAVVRRCGAPVEAHLHGGGLLILYRERRYDYDRLGLDPSRAVGYLGVNSAAGDALSNLKLVLERGTLAEDRLALLFDRDDRLVAIAYRGADGRRMP
jgi:hypothetical protein